MGTSRSEGDIWSRLRIREDADPDEAAAIAAAIERVLRAGARDASSPTWDGDRWRFAGRLAAGRGRSDRVPAGVPVDPWVAANRLRR